MDDETMKTIASSLGDQNRNFIEQPLTQEEIMAIIQTYSKEIKREDLDPQLRGIYRHCVKILRLHLVLH